MSVIPFIPIFIATAISIWLLIWYVIAQGSWREFANAYPEGDFPTEPWFRCKSLRFDSVLTSYRGGVLIAFSESGVHLRMASYGPLFHPRILVPWRDVTALSDIDGFTGDIAELTIEGGAGPMHVTLYRKAKEECQKYSRLTRR